MNGRNKAPHTYLDEIETDINEKLEKLTEQTALYE